MRSSFQGHYKDATSSCAGYGLRLFEADRIVAKIRIFFFRLQIMKALGAITIPPAADRSLSVETKDSLHRWPVARACCSTWGKSGFSLGLVSKIWTDWSVSSNFSEGMFRYKKRPWRLNLGSMNKLVRPLQGIKNKLGVMENLDRGQLFF